MMKTEEIIERLRHPQKYAKKLIQVQNAQQNSVSPRSAHPLVNVLSWGIASAVALGVIITWMIVLHTKNRAENLAAALKPEQIQGLKYETEFNPRKTVTYVQIYEGQDRNVAVDELGTTLPIISRYNYQSITPKNYGIIGMAPWALTENFAANLQDPDLIRYLLDRKEVADAFIAREDVAPLLEDPQLLAAFAQDNATLDAFFSSDVVKKILANPNMVQAVSKSRLMSQLLTSKALIYYENHPQEAVKLIQASPALNSLRQNSSIRKAVTENFYLKPIANQLLGKQAAQRSPGK